MALVATNKPSVIESNGIAALRSSIRQTLFIVSKKATFSFTAPSVSFI